MAFVITPSYEDIFSDKRPELSELLSDIPSSDVLRLLSYLDAQLFLNEDIQTQFKLLKVLLKRQKTDTVINIIHNYEILNENAKTEFSVFSRLYIKTFIHYVLINYQEIPSIADTTPTQELNLLKAYLVISSIKNSETHNIYNIGNETKESDFFPTHTWPLIISQLDVNTKINPIPNIIRGVCLMNYLQYHSSYSKYVISFLNKKGLTNTWEYIMLLSSTIQLSWTKNDAGMKNYFFVCDDKFSALFDYFSINPSEYRERYLNKKEEHSLLKSKPLFKYENQYYVLDWNFMPNKIYEGLIFDFHSESGIKELSTLNTIPQFKRLIGLEITEKFIFRTILKAVFSDKYCKLIFPKDNSAGEPDAYYRKGNSIFLFEIKDSFFPTSAIKSSTYEDIKNAIDEKYNNDKKGTGQLVKQINRLKEKSYEEKDYQDLKIKVRNFNVYPIIIYTDKYFGMYGVSNYLIKEFDKKIEHIKLQKSFKKINNLTFLSLDYLILHSKLLSNNGFVKILDNLHKTIDDRKKKNDRIREVPVLMEYNKNMELILEESYKTENDKEMDIKEIMLLLNMTEGLPQS
ncbi:hypothetical protein SDC9_42967 [bioreactor metagenome]|uniref:Uncharacterized protein n=1 Tax=bioreactor metagenome TaxID=1076179 RepID=A0A644VZ69_9ZZZZ|nr:hypothetical protein [Paludibacter sp.]